MFGTKDYIQEVQKFTTSQYWNSGVRITAGMVLPMFLMIYMDWLTPGIPFLFGALFVGLTDTPGPIHHRRNGMLVAVLLNTITVLIVELSRSSESLLVVETLALSFVYSLIGIYGSRASAVGTLALVMMLIHMSPVNTQVEPVAAVLLTAGGGLWYTAFSLLLYRLQPYRLVEQALGENLMVIADYLRARGSFYKPGADIEASFNRVMKAQVEVLNSQTQMRDLLFRTRKFVSDASPRSRSIMMIFLESLDLFEETMYSYQDYQLLHKHIPPELLNRFYRLILRVVAEFEHIGLSVQGGMVIRKMPELSLEVKALHDVLREHRTASALEAESLLALTKTLANITGIVSRLDKIVLYTRMEAFDPRRFPDQSLQSAPPTEPFTFTLLRDNLTLRSNNFRYAVRTTIAMAVGFAIALLLNLSHAYWVLLTIVTILKPVYNLTRARNFQRVGGTLGGIVAGSLLLYFIDNNTVLLVLMLVCMLLAYSLLRLNYLGFVTFLTIYIIITFHFLNPVDFKELIGERLIDTLIGSVIAGVAARFILPVWQQNSVRPSMQKSLHANITYFLAVWNNFKGEAPPARKHFNAVKTEAIVALTNLSDNFQHMLAEPGEPKDQASVHQFVIASHTLTSRISALNARDFDPPHYVFPWVEKITETLQEAEGIFSSQQTKVASMERNLPPLPPLHPLSIILSLARDFRTIASGMPA